MALSFRRSAVTGLNQSLSRAAEPTLQLPGQASVNQMLPRFNLFLERSFFAPADPLGD